MSESSDGMSGFTIGDLGVFIGTIGGVITSILIVLQKSKCKTIRCCGLVCEREVPPPQLPNEPEQAEQEQENLPLNQLPNQDLPNP